MKLTPSGDNYFSLDRVLSWKEFAKNAKKNESDDFVEMANIEDDIDESSAHELMVKPEHGQLALDIYQTAADLIVEAPIAGVNPQEYLADVLIRVQSHPASRIAELTPERWKAARAEEAAAAKA